MKPNVAQLELNLIRRAQSGCQDSVSRLSRLAQKRVQTYIYRMTLDFHLAQDLCQDTLLEMIRHLPELRVESPPAFWAWLHKTALNKIRYHIRQRRHSLVRQSIESLDDAALAERLSEAGASACDKLIHQEVVQAVVRAMASLKLNYRSVLTLRCFDDLSYVEIAEVMGGSQLRARLLFFRAKKSLRRQLARNGFGRMHLVSGLTVFGAITACTGRSAAAGVLIGQNAMRTGLRTAALAAAASKAGLTAAAVVVAVPMFVAIGALSSGLRQADPAAPATTPIAEVQEEFAYPSAVVGSSNPEGNGWTCVDLSEAGMPAARVDAPTVLVRRPHGDSVALVLPENHWVQLGFGSTLCDAAGPDLLVTGADIEDLPEVAAVSDTNDLFVLAPEGAVSQASGVTLITYDFAQVPASARLAAVRIRGLAGNGAQGGFQLVGVQARTVPVRAPQTAQLLP